MHPEYQTKPAFDWVKVGANPAVLSTAGRGRVTIHGAVNLETFDAPFVEPLSVDGVRAVQHLAKIEERNPDKRTSQHVYNRDVPRSSDRKGRFTVGQSEQDRIYDIRCRVDQFVVVAVLSSSPLTVPLARRATVLPFSNCSS